MKKLVSLLFFAQIAYAAETVDKILAIIYMGDVSTIVTQSDLRPRFSPEPRTLEEVVLEKLKLEDAKSLKVNMTDSDVEKRIAMLMQQHKLTQEGLMNIFKQGGMTNEEAREFLKDQLTVEAIEEFRVKGKLIIEKKEIEEFYNANPVMRESSYTLSQAFYPFTTLRSKEDQHKDLKKEITSGEVVTKVQWESPFELKDSEFAEDKKFIQGLESGSVVQLQETEHGVMLLRLLTKTPQRLIPLEERVREITGIIGEKKYYAAQKSYNDDLLEKAQGHIKYTDPVATPATVPPAA